MPARRPARSRRPLARLVVTAVSAGLLGLAAAAPAAAAPAAAPAVRPVASLDVQRYLGTWRQIADIPQFYEVFCVKDVTARYSLNTDGTVRVLNTCTGPLGGTIRTDGTARILDRTTNAQLQVSFLKVFGTPVFTGSDPNYVVMGIAGDYSWAVVGDPSRSTGYILSRTAGLPAASMKAAKAVLVRNGYDPCALRLTRQTGGSSSTAPIC